MKRIKNKIITALLCALLVMIPALTALAVELKAESSSASVTAGDTVDVTLSVSGKSLAVVEGVFSYDPTLLSFEESNGGAGDGFINIATAEKGGSSTLSAHARFKAIAAGTAAIDFTIEKALDYDGKEQDGASGSVSITIQAAPEARIAATDYSQEGVAAQNVPGASEALYIWRSLENVTIPSKYSETELEYHGEKVMGATVPDSDAPTLLYLSNAAGENAAYYIYDAQSDSFSTYQTLSSVSKSYILLQPGAGVQAPEGFAQDSLTVDEDKQIPVWKSQDAAGDVYLVYARNPDGEVGFYYYNPQDQSLQRYSVLPARPVQPQLTPEPVVPAATAEPAPVVASEPVAKDGEISIPELYVYAACGVVILLIVILIIVLLSHAAEKKRRRERAQARRAERERQAREQGGRNIQG